MQKGKPVSYGSKMLGDYISPVDATVVERLAAAGAEIVGTADIGEFGIDGLLIRTNELSPYNAMLTETVNAIKSGKADFALFNDYTGAISRACAAQGLFYIHPTYGTVSRYGLIPAVTSMDQIGIACTTPGTGFKALGIIAGYDQKDGIMAMDKLQTTVKSRETKRLLKIAEPELKHSEIYSRLMQILCCAELSCNISRYDSVKFGYRAKEYNGLNELYTKSRTEAFGEDVKLAAILGAMVLSQENYTRYYDKAMRMRRLIKDSPEFDKYDVIKASCPLLSRLCGLPSLTAPGDVYVANAGREDILEALDL